MTRRNEIVLEDIINAQSKNSTKADVPTLLVGHLAGGSDKIYLRYWDRIYQLHIGQDGTLELTL